jgi:uncharacterized protein
MKMSMYQATVPMFISNLNSLDRILAKGAGYAAFKNIDPTILIRDRLFPDMYTLVQQVQIATDISRIGVSRLAGVISPSFEDNETTFEELQDRIQRTIAYLETISPEQVDKSEDKEINYNFQGEAITCPGIEYVQKMMLPVFFFHVTTAFNILRHNGVEIGKKTYLGLT